MQNTQRQINVLDIVERLKQIFGVETDIALNDALKLKHGTVGTWKSRNTLNYKKILAYCENIDLNWLFYGHPYKGEMPEKITVPEFKDDYSSLLASYEKISSALVSVSTSSENLSESNKVLTETHKVLVEQLAKMMDELSEVRAEYKQKYTTPEKPASQLNEEKAQYGK